MNIDNFTETRPQNATVHEQTRPTLISQLQNFQSDTRVAKLCTGELFSCKMFRLFYGLMRTVTNVYHDEIAHTSCMNTNLLFSCLCLLVFFFFFINSLLSDEWIRCSSIISVCFACKRILSLRRISIYSRKEVTLVRVLCRDEVESSNRILCRASIFI